MTTEAKKVAREWVLSLDAEERQLVELYAAEQVAEARLELEALKKVARSNAESWKYKTPSASREYWEPFYLGQESGIGIALESLAASRKG